MIFVRPMGQLGNQMFQYCIGHIASAVTGHEYQPHRWIGKCGESLRWNMSQYLHQEHSQGIGSIGDDSHTMSFAHWIDLKTLPVDRDIMLKGYFQRYELIKPYKQLVRDHWLKIHTKIPLPDPDALVIHVRRTDYAVDGDHRVQCLAHDMDEYAACIDTFGNDIRRLILVSDDYNDPFLREFHVFGKPVYYSTGPWDRDFLVMAGAASLIISQSTFSWWAAFLGHAIQIACPLTPGSHWHRGAMLFGPPPAGEPDYPNLIVDDEPGRWLWV